MRKFFKGATFYILIFLIILMIVQFYGKSPTEIVKINATQLLSEMNNGTVNSINIVEDDAVVGTLQNGTKFETHIPEMMSEPYGNFLFEKMNSGEINIEGTPAVKPPWFIEMLPTIFLILILVVFWLVFMQNSQGGGSKVMSFGKSKAKLHKDEDGKKIMFSDVAGLKEEKEELWEVVDFLKAPKKYMDLGARIPKGILMVGPPGTGKTYLTRAIAGEAGVPFFSISGSDFVEMFVGVGASRVRDLFDNAKKNAPCIVFIDEIDAVGRKRGAGLGGGHDEREQTLNQLLVEMDGFSDNEGIIMIAATNRPDILDPAILRPGRFDRQITVGLPDIKEREDILRVHARNKPIDEDVDFKVLARSTPGFTPADLENLLNESALLSARRRDPVIHMETIKEATIKVIGGVEKKSRVISEKERRLTAYHEGGHAVLAYLLPEMDPVHQVTIIPRGRAGGFTMQLPTEDRSYATKKSMERELIVLLGGRIAEKLILHDISTGAQNDLSRVSKIAKAMITKYAMSENLSSMTYGSQEEVFIGRDMTTQRDHSEQVAAEIDREVRRIVDDAYDKAMTLLEENQDKLHLIAEALLEHETIHGEEFYVLMNEGKAAFDEKITEFEQKREEERKKIEARRVAENQKEQAREEAEKRAFEALMKARSEAVAHKHEKHEAAAEETEIKPQEAPVSEASESSEEQIQEEASSEETKENK
ncbi:MAG: ATP-dependent zinc metalloprotease FtsH [Clostridia bacterium]|nr:ATP-dependent zinc metalloprotease FtsH [Clostridia bacterium]